MAWHSEQASPPSPLRNRSQREAARLRLPSSPKPDRTRPQKLDSTILLNAAEQSEEVTPLFLATARFLATPHILQLQSQTVLVTW